MFNVFSQVIYLIHFLQGGASAFYDPIYHKRYRAFIIIEKYYIYSFVNHHQLLTSYFQRHYTHTHARAVISIYIFIITLQSYAHLEGILVNGNIGFTVRKCKIVASSLQKLGTLMHRAKKSFTVEGEKQNPRILGWKY